MSDSIEPLRPNFARIMERPISAFQIRVIVICSLVVLLDGYDLQAMGLAVPAIAAQWHMAPAAFGPSLAASVLGLGLGSAFLAPFGDQVGRRPVLIAGLLTIAVTALGTVTATHTWHLIVWRALTGAALGVCQANAFALTGEYSPLARRAGLMTLMGCSVSVGAVIAGLTAPWVIGHYGWHGLFIIGGVLPLVVSIVAFTGLPESLALLVARDHRDPRIAQLARRIAPDLTYVPDAPDPRETVLRGSVRTLLTPPYRERTLRLWFVYGLTALLMYFFVSWLPAFLSAAGWSHAAASRGIALYQFGGIIGALAQAWLLDRQRTVPALAGAFIITTLGAMLFAVPGTRPLWPVLLVVIGSGVAGATFSIFALAALFYPPAIRVTGFGWTAAVARVGAVLGPLAGGWILARGVSAPTIIGLIAIPAALCLIGVLGMGQLLSRIPQR